MTRRFALALATTALALAAVVVACTSKTASAACSTGNDCLPAITFEDIHKEMYPPDALRGKVVVVNFWATWCKPCEREIPALNRVYAKYKDQGVLMLGVLQDNQVDDNGLLNFMSDHEFTYPVVRADQEILTAYEYPPAIPVTYVYDRRGKLARFYKGAVEEDELAKQLDAVLAQK